AADKSYGIHVAQLAELPDAIINRAQTILTELESGSHDVTPTVSAASKAEKTVEKQQLSFFEVEEKPQPKAALKQKDQAVIDELKSYNLMDMTPLEAMTKLYELQKKL
ncbi:DNA mismatch repair protein MutS, partial [Bacillus safensis]